MSIKEPINALDYLALSNGVRLHWSEVRQQHWLLFPEGAIALNDNAVAILTLCNGDRSFKELVTDLEKQFNSVKQSDVRDFLSQMMKRGLIARSLFQSQN